MVQDCNLLNLDEGGRSCEGVQGLDDISLQLQPRDSWKHEGCAAVNEFPANRVLIEEEEGSVL